MLSVKRALLMSTGERYVVLIANFATAAGVSRILTPREIGVSAIGMAVLAIVTSVREFSSPSYLIQREELSREDIRSASTVVFILTGLIAATLVVVSPGVASLYDEPNLVPYFRVISICLFLDALIIPITAMLRREMAFGKIAAINTTGAAMGSVATIALAFEGFSYMSFAWGWLIGSGLAAALALALRPHFWMLKPSLTHWQGMISFGGYNGTIAIIFSIFDSLPLLLLGHLVSPNAAGLFNRTLLISQIPDKLLLGGAMTVVLPAFSAEARQGRDLKRPYLAALSFITALYWPALLVLAVLAYPAVEVVLGRQWIDVAPLVQVAAIARLFSFSFQLNYPVMVAVGAIRDLFIRALIVFPLSGIILSLAAVFGGLHAATWCMLVTVPFQAFVALKFVLRRLGLRGDEIAAALWKSAVIAAASAAAPLLVVALSGFDFHLSFGKGFGAGLLALGAWGIALILTRHPLLDEIVRTIPVSRRVTLRAGE